jgi:hypothetical protein
MDAQEVLQMLAARRKPITELVRDASELPPEITKFDSLIFTASVSTTGALLASVPLLRIPSDYDFSCYGMRGWVQGYAGFGDNAALVTFNARESGRNQDIFATVDQNLASLVTPSGPANDLIFPERQLFRAGSELQARFSFAAGYSTPLNRLMGFIFFGQLIAKGVGRR